MQVMRGVILAAAIAMPMAAHAEGNLAALPANRIELGITGAAMALSATTFEIETGLYYRLTITSDGAAEAMFRAPELLRNVWLNQVVINGIEVHVQGMSFYGLEFDVAGTVFFSFVPIRPGEYPFSVGESTGTFIVR
ncbi:MAG: hypothetical protein AB7O56_05185 [Bauldia sp.]